MKTFNYMLFFVICTLSSFGYICYSQMLDPDIDRPDEPFCYFSEPTDVIGVMDGREGTLISPEGYLYTGYGELMFFAGNPPQPIRQRVKTSQQGYLPVINYTYEKEDISHQFTLFAATLDGRPESALINFIRVRITNQADRKRTVYFSTAIRYQNEANTDWGVGDNKFGRPADAELIGRYEQSGAEFTREWEYAFIEDALLRDGDVMYLFPTKFDHELFMTLKTGYNEQQQIAPMKLYVLPTTPVGMVMYRLTLKAGESRTLEFKMPYEPIPVDDAILSKLREADFNDYLSKTESFWNRLIDSGIEISVPEEKVVNTFKANLIYDLIARDKIDSFYVQKVNEFQYDAFWLRDAAYIARMYDVSGYHDIARQCLDFFGRWQRDDGNFVSHGGQYDGWGQTLWAYSQHFKITCDTSFAEKVFPSVKQAYYWLKNARRSDPLNLIPVTTPGDNEEITGHVTGHNFWALIGLKNAIALAKGLGEIDDATLFQEEYNDLLSSLLNRINEVTANTSGYVPPGLDTPGGQDWGNMMAVYPEIILDPFDPWVSATLEMTRAKYQEGIMTYGDGRYLHHYLTMKNTETELIRGEQEKALQEFYAVLMHTSATHAGFEFSIRPWGVRDFGMNLAPHGWFSATFRTLFRNMMVREQGENLHLLSLMSPEWVQEGKSIVVRRAATNFGVCNFELNFNSGSAVLNLDNEFRTNPEKLILHLPWFWTIDEVRIDDKVVKIQDRLVDIPLSARQVAIKYKHRDGTIPYSYSKVVEDYKIEYRRRYEEFLKNGSDK